MRVLSFVTQKGGSGKTSLALSCAVAAEEAGQRVLLIDLDPQGTAETWDQDREAETPKLVRIDAPELEDALATARGNAFDLVLIDTQVETSRARRLRSGPQTSVPFPAVLLLPT